MLCVVALDAEVGGLPPWSLLQLQLGAPLPHPSTRTLLMLFLFFRQDVDELVARADEVVEKGLLFTVVAGQEPSR